MSTTLLLEQALNGIQFGLVLFLALLLGRYTLLRRTAGHDLTSRKGTGNA